MKMKLTTRKCLHVLSAAALLYIQANTNMMAQCFLLVVHHNSNKSHIQNHRQALYYRYDEQNQQRGNASSSSSSSVNDEKSQTAKDHQSTTNNKNDKDNAAQCNINNIGGDTDASLICEKQLDYIGAGTLGDIMSDPSQDDDNGNDEASASSPSEDGNGNGNGDNINGVVVQNNRLLVKNGLVTSTGGTLTSQFGHKIPDLSPLDRIALTANGNLQRIFSSFYDAPVHVHVDRCVKRESDDRIINGYGDDDDEAEAEAKVEVEAVWDRIVHLSVFDQVSS